MQTDLYFLNYKNRSKSSLPNPEIKTSTENISCGNMLSLSIKLEKLIQIFLVL